MAKWKAIEDYYVLTGTDIELVPEYKSPYWFVVNKYDGERALTDALPLKTAKKAGERIARIRE